MSHESVAVNRVAVCHDELMAQTPDLEPRRPWMAAVWARVRTRPDLLVGLGLLAAGTAAVCWIGMWEVPWYARIPVILVAVTILVGMTLGMISDYTDQDERDSAAWLASQAALHHKKDE